MRKAGWLLATIVATYTWLDFIWPPIHIYLSSADYSISRLLVSLVQINSPIYPGLPCAGWLFLIATVVPIYFAFQFLIAAWRYFSHALEPVSVLETDFKIILSDDMRNAITTRTQLIFANRNGINAYEWTTSTASASGEIVLESVSCKSVIDGECLTKDVLKTTETLHEIEAIEIFTNPLPVSALVTLLPNQLLLFAYKKLGLFSKYIVQRTTEHKLLNEYDRKHGSFRVKFDRNSRQSIRLKVDFDFPQTGAPQQSAIRAFLCQNHSATSVPVSCTTNNDRICYGSRFVQFPPGASLRLCWQE